MGRAAARVRVLFISGVDHERCSQAGGAAPKEEEELLQEQLRPDDGGSSGSRGDSMLKGRRERTM